MNKKFMVKMMKAKKLECEAMMEILPQNLIDKIKKMEYEMIDILKEVILDTESDQAHSLSDSFDISLSNQPTMVTTHLYAMEIDVVEESERAYGKLKSYLNKLLTSKTENSIEAEELLVFPGLEELCSLLKVKELYDQGEYDVLIVDCAPDRKSVV